jgi:hypothetical protein
VVDVRQATGLPPLGAMRGYDFAVLIPAYDLRLPCSWLVKSSAMACGQRILTMIARAENPLSWSLAFALTTVQRQNEKGRWFVPQAMKVAAKPKNVEAAGEAAELLRLPSG